MVVVGEMSVVGKGVVVEAAGEVLAVVAPVLVGKMVVMTGVASSLVSPVVVTAAVLTEHRGVGDAG